MYRIKKNLNKLNRISKIHDYYSNPNGIYLNRNERILKFSKSTIKRFKNTINSESLSLYPDFNRFYKKLSKWLGVNQNEIFLNEGVSGLLKCIFECYCEEGRSNIILPYPTFAMYNVYSKMYGIKIKKLKYNKKYQLDLNNLEKLIDQNTSLVILPNPNVPIEGILNLNEIFKILTLCKKNKVMLVIDEVYFPFSSVNSLNLFKKYKNYFIILRSFSKAFGLAGIRLGYAIGSSKNILYLSKTRSGYETNSLSILIAENLIENFKEVKNYIKEIKDGLNYLKIKLNKNNIKYSGGNNGNYIFIIFKNKKEANFILKKLSLKKIYIRGGWPRPYDNGILVSGAPINIMTKFYNEFEKIYLK